MSDFNPNTVNPVSAAHADMSVDVGLRAFMLGVYNKLALGLVLSAGLAFLTSSYAPVRDLMFNVVTLSNGQHAIGMTGLGELIAFAPLLVLLGAMFVMRNPSPRASGILYWTIVSLIGASSGIWLLLKTDSAVALSFLITASAFGALSLFGYATKRDLTGIGSFLIMGVWGLIAAMLVNMFWNPPGFSFVISGIGVLVFAGLTAYDTQKLKMTYYALGGNQAAMGVATNFGALRLYLDFINLFQFILAMTGGGRR